MPLIVKLFQKSQVIVHCSLSPAVWLSVRFLPRAILLSLRAGLGASALALIWPFAGIPPRAALVPILLMLWFISCFALSLKMLWKFSFPFPLVPRSVSFSDRFMNY